MTPGQQYRYETVVIHKKQAGYNNRKDINLPGDWLYIQSITNNGHVSFDDGPPIPMWAGAVYPLPFKKVSLINDVQDVQMTVSYLLGSGYPPEFPILDTQVTQFKAQAILTVGAGSEVQLFTGPIRASRVWVSVPEGEANGVYIGDVVGPSYGLYVPVGFPIAIQPGGSPLYARNPGASAVALTWCLEQIA